MTDRIKDTGTRQQYATGARRDSQAGKGRFDLIPPSLLFALARLYEAGAEKYAARNWEKGIPSSRFASSALRHLVLAINGFRDEPHMAAAVFNIAGLIHNEYAVSMGLLPPGLLDLPETLDAGYDEVALRELMPGVYQTTTFEQAAAEAAVTPQPALALYSVNGGPPLPSDYVEELVKKSKGNIRPEHVKRVDSCDEEHGVTEDIVSDK